MDRELDVLSIIRREEIHESSFVQELVREGELIGARKSILQVLELRFREPLGNVLSDTLESITDVDRLRNLFRVAIQARRLSQFRRALIGS